MPNPVTRDEHDTVDDPSTVDERPPVTSAPHHLRRPMLTDKDDMPTVPVVEDERDIRELLALTSSEWNLLVALTSTPRCLFSRHKLIERVGGSAFEGYERAVGSHVKNLRHKLGPDGQHVVETVVGFGYRSGAHPDG